MKGLLQVRFRISGLSAEKLLNEARKRQIPLQSISRQADRSLFVCCTPGSYRALAALAGEKGFSVTQARPTGLLRLLYGFRRRWGLLAGACLCLCLLIFAMGFVWRIEIENAGIYEGEVRLFLDEVGVHPGLRRSEIDLTDLRQKLEWRLPRVKWVRAEWAGVVLRIRLEEGVPPPGVSSAGLPGDIVAAEDGILLRLTCYAGTPLCREGDLVRAGQVLIRGTEKGASGQTVAVKAQGEAIARVWVSAKIRMPVTEYETVLTGRAYNRRVIALPFLRWSFQDTPDYLQWDMNVQETLLGGAWLPVRLIREEYMEAALELQTRDTDTVCLEAGRGAMQMLEKTYPDEDFVDKWVDYSMIEGDIIVATATAEIRRDIARYQKTP